MTLTAPVEGFDATTSWGVAVTDFVNGVAVGGSRTAYATGDQSVTSSTTLVSSDKGLALPVLAGATYALDSFIAVDGAAASDWRYNFLLPAGSSMIHSLWGSGSGAATIEATIFHDAFVGTGTTPGLIGVGSPMSSRPIGTIYIGGTAGDVTFQFAQGVSGATATTLKGGSWFRLTRLA